MRLNKIKLTVKEKIMKKIIKSSLVLSTMVFAGFANSAELKLTVDNIQSDEGTIRVAFYNEKNKDNFPSGDGRIIFTVNGKEQYGLEKPAKVGAVKFTVNLPAGKYAVAVYHDINGDKKLNKVPLVGLPIEPYGFSQDARGAFGPASFEEAEITIGNSGTSHTLDVQ